MNLTFTTWTCPQCKGSLGWLVIFCVYCEVYGRYNLNPDIASRLENPLTPQEELFATLFNGYKTKPAVVAMTDLELHAHREELCEIAFKARAHIGAVDEIIKERKPKQEKYFHRSIEGDSTSSDAINIVKERQARLTKREKIIEGLVKLGYTQADAEKKMSAGALLGMLKNKEENKTEEKKEEPKQPLFNPFKKES